MANDRMYIRCKGCGDLHFLAKCYDDGYFTTHEGEELRQGLDDFLKRHKWCYRDKYYGGFELVYESDDWLEKQKEQKQGWSEEDQKMIDCIINVLASFSITFTSNYNGGTSISYGGFKYQKEMDWLKSLRPSWKPSEEQQSGSSALKAEGTNE